MDMRTYRAAGQPRVTILFLRVVNLKTITWILLTIFGILEKFWVLQPKEVLRVEMCHQNSLTGQYTASYLHNNMGGYGYVVCCMMLLPSSWCWCTVVYYDAMVYVLWSYDAITIQLVSVGVPLYTMMLWCMFYDDITIQLMSMVVVGVLQCFVHGSENVKMSGV